MVVAALGILKADGAYLPLDPAYPAERLAFMLEDAQVPVLITTSEIAQRLPEIDAEVVTMSAPQIMDNPDHLPRIDVLKIDLAYAIYTSGSTGTPKGVEITHAGLANLVAWHCQAFSVTPADRASHLAGLGFDAAVWELWPYLTAGASVHLADDVTRSSPELLRDWLVAKGITISFVPTPLAERMLFLDWPRETALRIMLTGGDTLHHYPPRGLPFALINNYGPTECTVVATSGQVLPETQPDVLPAIGKPIANTRIYLLDEQLREVPAGDPGELYIESIGLARGYHNRRDLTDERFAANPFGEQPGSRLYKTGDLARLLPDGQFAFLGRVDDQIKIRGYRIEPKEIVCALNRHPDVRDSLVVAREEISAEKRLVAYVILDPVSGATSNQLRELLREHLPEYMVPSVFVRLGTFPLTAHGKIDHASLPEPDAANTLQDEVATGPRTPTEQRVAEIISCLLELEEVGVDDNFFMLGGHSLLGVQLIARLREAFGVQIGLRSLFTAPTVAELSLEIERLATSPTILESEPLSACMAAHSSAGANQ
jgi:amino acid adenylation domain-containing protein